MYHIYHGDTLIAYTTDRPFLERVIHKLNRIAQLTNQALFAFSNGATGEKHYSL